MRSAAPVLVSIVALVSGAGPGWAKNAAVNADSDYTERYACVDRLSATNLGRGSMELASDIAERCLAAFLSKHRSAYHVADVKQAAANAPGSAIIDLIGKVPGIGDVGAGGMLTLRAEQNLDCRSIHPGEKEMVCNRPIDKAWIYDNWPWWQKEFGGTREDYERDQLRFALQDQERRRKMMDIAAHSR